MFNLNRITKLGDRILADLFYSVSQNYSRAVFPKVL